MGGCVLTCFLYACVLTGIVYTARDVCLGSNCECTDYPVKIVCREGHPQLLPKMVKRTAVSLEINGDSIDHVLAVDLQDYVSLKKLIINVYKKDVCFWGLSKREHFPNIDIITPDFCSLFEVKDGPTPTSTGVDVAGGSNQNTKGTVIYLHIKAKDWTITILFFFGMTLCGLCRGYLR